MTYTIYSIFHLAGSQQAVHMSAHLHALMSMTAPQFQLQPSELESPNVLLRCDEEAMPVTSRLCQWKAPRKRKESTMAPWQCLRCPSLNMNTARKRRGQRNHWRTLILVLWSSGEVLVIISQLFRKRPMVSSGAYHCSLTRPFVTGTAAL